jgi:hypothetical protein
LLLALSGPVICVSPAPKRAGAKKPFAREAVALDGVIG